MMTRDRSTIWPRRAIGPPQAPRSAECSSSAAGGSLDPTNAPLRRPPPSKPPDPRSAAHSSNFEEKMSQSSSLTFRVENSLTACRASWRNASESKFSSDTPITLQPGMNPDTRQMEQSRQQLALRQVAGRAHEHHDLRVTGTTPRATLAMINSPKGTLLFYNISIPELDVRGLAVLGRSGKACARIRGPPAALGSSVRSRSSAASRAPAPSNSITILPAPLLR